MWSAGESRGWRQEMSCSSSSSSALPAQPRLQSAAAFDSGFHSEMAFVTFFKVLRFIMCCLYIAIVCFVPNKYSHRIFNIYIEYDKKVNASVAFILSYRKSEAECSTMLLC